MSISDSSGYLSSQVQHTHNSLSQLSSAKLSTPQLDTQGGHPAGCACAHCSHGNLNLPKGSPSAPSAFSHGSSTPKPDTSNHPLANQLTIDPSDLFSGSAVMTQAQPSEPLDGTPTYSVTDSDPNRPGMQIDVVVSRDISPVDLEEVKQMLREDIKFRQDNGWPPVEYYIYRNRGEAGENKYGGDMSGNGVNFLDFTAMQDSDPNRDGIQIDVVIDPRTTDADRQKIYTALREWSSAITGASGTPFEFYVWSDASKVRKQGEYLNFTPLKDNGDNNFDGRTYWSTPDQGRIVAFEPGSPLSIVLHEIGHAMPLPAHTDGVMKGINPTTTIDQETIDRVLRIYDLSRR